MIHNKGQSIIELLLAIGLSSLIIPALVSGFATSYEGEAQQKQRLEAVAYLKEAEEAFRSVREKGWSYISTNGTYHPEIDGSSWSLVSGSETIKSFTREVAIDSVYRDGAGKIVETGGNLDPSTKKVMITVSWSLPKSTSVASVNYFTRYLNNAAYSQTTQADFSSGTDNGTVVVNTNGGEVVLGAGGHGNWCSPNLSIQALDLPKSGVANTITAIEGEAFAGTGENASGVSLADINITDTNPPEATIIDTLDGYKTNKVFGEDNFFYLATDTNNSEIVIIDISGSPFTEIGHFDSPGPTNGETIYVQGNTGYMTAGSTLYNFDLSTKIGSRSAIDPDGVSLSGTGTELVVVDNYAYVSIASGANHLQVIDISDPADLTVVAYATVDGQDAQDVFVNQTGTRAYLATSSYSGQDEMFIIDTSEKNGSLPVIGSYDTNGMDPKGVVVVPGNRAIISGSNGEEYQVVTIVDEANPTRCGGLEIDAGINDITAILESDGDAYAYIVTGDSNSEFKIIEGGPGGQYTTSGDFESATFDPGFEATFNRFDVSYVKPAFTDISFQIAVADAIDGSCGGAGFIFVGPDGTSDTYFTDSFEIPLDNNDTGYENPGRCFRYKAYLSTEDSAFTPVFEEIVVNYSP